MPFRVGTPGNDTLTGDSTPEDARDALYGVTGNDILLGGEDDDMLDGGWGNDTLSGGSGGDSLFGQEGNDVLNGGDGNDSLYGMKGDDVLNGDAGEDFLVDGMGGNDILNGGADNDSVYVIHHPISKVVRETNTVDGGSGYDTITFGYVFRLYSVTTSGSGATVVFNLPGREATYHITNVEQLVFPYRTIDLSAASASGATTRAPSNASLGDALASRPLTTAGGGLREAVRAQSDLAALLAAS